MGRTLSQIVSGLPADRRRKNEARVSEIIAELPGRPPARRYELGAKITKRTAKKLKKAPAAAKRRPIA